MRGEGQAGHAAEGKGRVIALRPRLDPRHIGIAGHDLFHRVVHIRRQVEAGDRVLPGSQADSIEVQRRHDAAKDSRRRRTYSSSPMGRYSSLVNATNSRLKG